MNYLSKSFGKALECAGEMAVSNGLLCQALSGSPVPTLGGGQGEGKGK